jgi:hypothetical protein
MNLKNFSISIALMMAFMLLGIVSAALLTQYMIHSTGTITEAKATITIDGTTYVDGQTFNWGPMMRGYTYIAVLKVANTGGVPFNITLAIETVPIGISYTWLANKTIVQPGNFAEADLEITVANTVALGTYSLGTYYVRLYEVP